MIYIFTGPIGSGKTTQLEKWVKTQDNAGGILMPVCNGERHLFSILSKKLVPIEIKGEAAPDEIVKVGKFSFSKKVFDYGNSEILRSIDAADTVIIDEIGPLELSGKGFFTSLKTIFEDKKRFNVIDLVLVIREGLVELTTENFGLKDYSIITNISSINS
ncbi:MAG: nucleoside-triphosphatase [Acidobacteriota bacterium]